MNADGSDDQLTDLGHNVWIAVRKHPDEGWPMGMYYEHPCAGGKVSPDYVPFNTDAAEQRGFTSFALAGWDLVKLEPLTLSPSLLCTVCGHHGFVQGGRWIPCG